MTAHELARKLLEGPDLPVTVYDSGFLDPDRHTVGRVLEFANGQYWDIFASRFRDGPHLLLEDIPDDD